MSSPKFEKWGTGSKVMKSDIRGRRGKIEIFDGYGTLIDDGMLKGCSFCWHMVQNLVLSSPHPSKGFVVLKYNAFGAT